jgi:hypothetical protein
MSYKRITSFTSWLANKWFGNLFRSFLKLHLLPLKLHKKCILDSIGNILIHITLTGFIVIIVCIVTPRDEHGKYQEVSGYWDIALYAMAIHFLYCIIINQYNKYISDMNSTLDRLKDQSSHE